MILDFDLNELLVDEDVTSHVTFPNAISEVYFLVSMLRLLLLFVFLFNCKPTIMYIKI
jgi:hypothetical protein